MESASGTSLNPAGSSSSKHQAASNSQGTARWNGQLLRLRAHTQQTASLPPRELPASTSHYLEPGLRSLTTSSRGTGCELQAHAGTDNMKEPSETPESCPSIVNMHDQKSLINSAINSLFSVTSGWKTPTHRSSNQECSYISWQGAEADDEESNVPSTWRRNRVFHIRRADKYKKRELDTSEEEEETLDRQASIHSAGSYGAMTHILSTSSRSSSRPSSSLRKENRPTKQDTGKTKARMSDTESDELQPLPFKMVSNANIAFHSQDATQPVQPREPTQTYSLHERVSSIENPLRDWRKTKDSTNQVMQDWLVLNKTLSSSEDSVRKVKALDNNKPDHYSHLNKSNNAKSNSDCPTASKSKNISGKIATDLVQDKNKENTEAENNNKYKLFWITEAESNPLSKDTGRSISKSAISLEKPFQYCVHLHQESHYPQDLEEKPHDNISYSKHINKNLYYSTENVVESSKDLGQAKHILPRKATSCSLSHKNEGLDSRFPRVLRERGLPECLKEAGKEMATCNDQIKQSPYQDIMSEKYANLNTGLQTRQHLNQELSPVLVPKSHQENNFSSLGSCFLNQKGQRLNGCKPMCDSKFAQDLYLQTKHSVSPQSFISHSCPSIAASAKISKNRHEISPGDNSLKNPRDHHMETLAQVENTNEDCLNPRFPSTRKVRLFTLGADSDAHSQKRQQTASKECLQLSLKKIATASNINKSEASSVCCPTENVNARHEGADGVSRRPVNDVSDDISPHIACGSSPSTLLPLNQVITCNITGKGSVRLINSSQAAVVLHQVFDWNFVAHSAENVSENSRNTFDDNDQSLNYATKLMGSGIASKQINKLYANHDTALGRRMTSRPSAVPEVHINSPHQSQTLTDNKVIKHSFMVHMPSPEQYAEIFEQHKEVASTTENCAEFDTDSDFEANPCPSPASQPEDWNQTNLLCTNFANFGQSTSDRAEPTAGCATSVNKIIQVDIDLQEETKQHLPAIETYAIKTNSSTNNLTTVVKSVDARPSIYGKSASHIENKIVVTDDLTTTVKCVEKTCPRRHFPPVLMCYKSTTERDLNEEQLLEIVLQIATIDDLNVTSKTLARAKSCQPKTNLTKDWESAWNLEDSKWEPHAQDEGVVWYGPLPASKSDLSNTLTKGSVPAMEKITDCHMNSLHGPDGSGGHVLSFILSLNAFRDRKSVGQVSVSDKRCFSDVAVKNCSPNFTCWGYSKATCPSQMPGQTDDALNQLTGETNKVCGRNYNEQSCQPHSEGKKLDKKDKFIEENPFLEENNACIPSRQRNNLQLDPPSPVQKYDFYYNNFARTNTKIRRIIPSISAFNHTPKRVLICSKPVVLHRRKTFTSLHLPSPDSLVKKPLSVNHPHTVNF